MQKRSNLYIFGFATLVTVFASIVLSLAATALKPMQELNARLDVVKNILSVAGYESDRLNHMKPDEMLEIYRKQFEVHLLNRANKPAKRGDLTGELKKLGYSDEDLEKRETFEILQMFNSKIPLLARRAKMKAAEYDPGYKLVYVYKPEKAVEGYIVPISGNGLWGMIYGYFALEPDLKTVKGIRFYNHQETPGLGGEIEKPWFTSQFPGKQILDEKGNLVSVTIEKGKAAVKHPPEELPYYVDGISGATITGKSVNKFLKADLEKYEPYFSTLRAEDAQTHESDSPAPAADGNEGENP